MHTMESRKSLRLTIDFLRSIARDRPGTPTGREAAIHANAMGFMLDDFEAQVANLKDVEVATRPSLDDLILDRIARETAFAQP